MILQQGSLKTIIKTGLLAGTLDGLAAALLYSIPSGKDPLNVYRFIASGVFGKEAFQGGVIMAMLGILFHYVIATGWTVLFFAAYPRIELLSKSKIATGIFYGIFVWIMMNLVVVPLSSVSMKGSRELSSIIIGMAVLIFCIGLPISWMASRYYTKQA
jgi:uncharacterized membrane protein YagU involved in acid resistance